MIIKKATLTDLEELVKIEQECFNELEAATKETFYNRLKAFNNYHWLLIDNNQIISFINGMLSDEENLKDEMYHNANLHNPNGLWFHIFGVDTILSYRKKGCASKLLNQVISDLKKEGRKGIVLTCKEKLIPFYSKFGFMNEGLSKSVHGNATWYQMRLVF